MKKVLLILYNKFRNFSYLWLLFLGEYLFLLFVLLTRKNFKDRIMKQHLMNCLNCHPN